MDNDKQPQQQAQPQKPPQPVEAPKHKPGDGIRSMQSTTVFRMVNFELYAKPVRTIDGYFRKFEKFTHNA